ncbi:MAG: GFA family protein [Cypionkella sp.]
MDAACHCGAVQFRLRLSDGVNSARRCDCSLCRMRGAVVVSARVGEIVFVRGEENLSLYQFNTKVARHYFCKTCGVYTHHQRRSDPRQFGVNVACITGMSPFDFVEVLVMNGVSHPLDAGGGDRVAGVLRYART